jgi:hypothetical protein
MDVGETHETPNRPRLGRRGWMGLILVALILGVPGFGHSKLDSRYYLAVAQHFQGEVPRDALQTPYAYRIALPWLASHAPEGYVPWAFGALNLTAVILACALFAGIWSHLLTDPRRWRIAVLLSIVSFPTVDYGSAVLTDPAGLLMFALGAYALTRRAWLGVGISLAVGVLFREAQLIVLLAAWLLLAYERPPKWILHILWLSLLAFAMAYFPRWYFHDVPASASVLDAQAQQLVRPATEDGLGFLWQPSMDWVLLNMRRPMAWLTLGLTLLPFLLLCIPFRWTWFPNAAPNHRRAITALALVCAALFLYSTAAAFTCGRFLWPSFVFLAPWAAEQCRIDQAPGRWATLIAKKFFGAQ